MKQPVLHVVGARPQFIKLSPVVQAFKTLCVPFKVVHTGQHYDYAMSDLHFDVLGLDEPDYNLDIGSAGHAAQTANMLVGIEEVLIKEKPALVVVYGDTNSTLAGALCAAKLCIPIAHVEAGVRSFDRSMPEEINRVLTDRISTHHFCPTANAVDLLLKEGIEGILTGDVMLDVLLRFSNLEIQQDYSPPFILVTIHRAENTNQKNRFLAIWEALKRLSRDIPIVFPVHPRTRNMYADIIEKHEEGINIVEPVSYLKMIAMIRDASCIITDSGGVQKEAFLLKTPCVTVRDTTEWPETVQAGANCLVETDAALICSAVFEMMERSFPASANPFGDGSAGFHIAQFIKENCFT